MLRNAKAVVTSARCSMFGLLAVYLFVLCLPLGRHCTAAEKYGKVKQSTKSRHGANAAFQWVKPKEYAFDMELGVMFRRSGDPGSEQCSVCLDAKDCIILELIRCDYYAETLKLLPDESAGTFVDSNPQLRAEVDSMLFSIIENYNSESDYRDCIPFISKYTDCTKETICTGCKTCDCDATGSWNCSEDQQCRPELVKPVADHRTLGMVLEKLKQPEPIMSRQKRSLDDVYHGYDDDSMLRHAKLAEWIFGEPTLRVDSVEHNVHRMYEEKKRTPSKTYQYPYQYKNLEPSKTINRKESIATKNDTKLLQFIVDTIIQDALPQIFRENNEALQNNRLKRMIANETKEDVKVSENKLSFEELSDWLNHVHPFIYVEKKNETDEGVNNNDANITGQQLKEEDNMQVLVSTDGVATENPATNATNDDPVLSYTNPEYLAFDEVYNNIAVDNKTCNRRKPPLDHKRMETEFNMYDDKYYYEEPKEQPSTARPIDPNVQMIVEELGVTVPPELNGVTADITDYFLESVTEVVVDLLESAKRNELNTANEKEYGEVNNKIDFPHFENMFDPSAISVMKRDVSVPKLQLNATNTTVANVSSPITDLKKDVIDPIGKMLKDKAKEMEDLLNIRNKLIAFVYAHKNLTTNNDKNSFLSLYQFEFSPHHHHELHNLRRSNVTILDSYLKKLKRDVYEVIRDVIAIRKLYNDGSKMPENLKFLIKALKHYVHKQGFHYRRKPNMRRNNDDYYSIKSTLIRIIELIDQRLTQNNALSSLSPHTGRLLQRVIRKNYVDEFAASGLRVYDPGYNLTKDLQNVGAAWAKLTQKIEHSSVLDLLYNMKQLHLILSVDISKLNDALALVNFARSRRMIPVNGVVASAIITNINKGIAWMKGILIEIFDGNKLAPQNQTAVEMRLRVPTRFQPKPIILKKYKKKDSFLTQIKTLLQKSKRDILNLLRKKIPKTDIVKQIAKKNMDEMTNNNFEATMQKWQTNLNIVRKKRSNLDRLSRRIKNIIPKYLRGKVSPMAMKKGKSKKKNMTLGHKKKIGNSTQKAKSTYVGTTKFETSTTTNPSNPNISSTQKQTLRR